MRADLDTRSCGDARIVRLRQHRVTLREQAGDVRIVLFRQCLRFLRRFRAGRIELAADRWFDLANRCGRDVGLRLDRRPGSGLRHGFRTFRSRRICIFGTEDLGCQVPRPACLLPSGQLAGNLGLVEDHVVAFVTEQRVHLVEMRFDLGIEVDHDHAGTGTLERIAIEFSSLCLIDDRRAGSEQRLAQMPARFAGLRQQRDRHGRIRRRHVSTSGFPGPDATDRLPGRACRGSVRRRFPARAGDAFRRYAR